MRILPPAMAFVAIGSSLLAQANCSAGIAPTTTLWTMNPFAGGSLYGHPNYPNSPGPTYPGFSFLIDMQPTVDILIDRVDIDLYDDGNLVQINSTTTVTSPNQVGATTTVTAYLFPGPTWAGQEQSPSNWSVLTTGTLTVAPHHTDSQMIFSPPIVVPAGSWGLCLQIPPTTNGPNPGPLHPMVDPTPTTQGVYVGTALTMINVNFQRESWTNLLTSPSHKQSLEFHYTPQSGYANSTSFGTGCGQPTPQLGLLARPAIGTTVDFRTTNIAAGASFNFFLFGFTPDAAGTNLGPYGLPGCSLHLPIASPIVTNVASVSLGASTVQMPLANDPALSGVILYSQAAPLLVGSPAFHVSNAICVAIGLF